MRLDYVSRTAAGRIGGRCYFPNSCYRVTFFTLHAKFRRRKKNDDIFGLYLIAKTLSLQLNSRSIIMASDPYHAVQAEIQETLASAGTLLASFRRIHGMGASGPSSGSTPGRGKIEESEELAYARSEVCEPECCTQCSLCVQLKNDVFIMNYYHSSRRLCLRSKPTWKI